MSSPTDHPPPPTDGPALPDGPAPGLPDSPALDPHRLAQVVPAPVSVRPDPGPGFALDNATVIRASAGGAAVAGYLADLLRPATGYPLPVAVTGDPVISHGGSATWDGALALTLGADTSAAGGLETDPPEPERPGLPRPRQPWWDETEGYRLDVTPSGVTIRAGTAAGLFHGVQTLRQLLPAAIESTVPVPGPWVVPAGRIEDHPRYPYRGAMLDVSRRFFPVPEVLRFVDHLARYKVNHLHLHLTDDQGWRIDIDAWPRLAQVGGAGAVGDRPGGCYSAQQYREIVEYAAARHITVVPEIDLPGHTNAALTAYGQLAPDDVAPPPYHGQDVGFSALAVDREVTYRFVADVLGEVATLTPGPYLHIGGDEAFTLDPTAYATIMDRVQETVAATGKTVVGWHQIAATRHVAGRILQYWGTSGVEPAVAAAVRQGARVVLSPGNRTYLDMKYTPGTALGKDWAGLIEVDTAYDWDPDTCLDGVSAEAVLGVEAPLWTETVTSLADAEYLTFPRLAAIAEVGWSPAARDWPGFRARLAAHGPRWDAAGITFHRSPQVPWASAPDGSERMRTDASRM